MVPAVLDRISLVFAVFRFYSWHSMKLSSLIDRLVPSLIDEGLFRNY